MASQCVLSSARFHTCFWCTLFLFRQLRISQKQRSTRWKRWTRSLVCVGSWPLLACTNAHDRKRDEKDCVNYLWMIIPVHTLTRIHSQRTPQHLCLLTHALIRHHQSNASLFPSPKTLIMIAQPRKCKWHALERIGLRHYRICSRWTIRGDIPRTNTFSVHFRPSTEACSECSALSVPHLLFWSLTIVIFSHLPLFSLSLTCTVFIIFFFFGKNVASKNKKNVSFYFIACFNRFSPPPPSCLPCINLKRVLVVLVCWIHQWCKQLSTLSEPETRQLC
jgi:hypothetical protein